MTASTGASSIQLASCCFISNLLSIVCTVYEREYASNDAFAASWFVNGGRAPGRPGIEPGKFLPVGGLERLDDVQELGRQRDVVEPVEQASAAQGMDAEGMRAALRVDRHLAFQIHRDLGAQPRPQLRAQRRASVGVEHDRHDAVLETVVE